MINVFKIQNDLNDLIFKSEKDFGNGFIDEQILIYKKFKLNNIELKRNGFLKRYYGFLKFIKEKA